MTSRDPLAHPARPLIGGLFFSLLLCAFILPTQAYARDLPDPLPGLAGFIESVKNGDGSVLRGVYVPNVMAYIITQQPPGDPGFVSTAASTVTQFSMASQAGNIGLLAHNYLAGGSFSKLIMGDQIILVYGDGRSSAFMVENILIFQALDPLDPRGLFRDQETQNTFTAGELFNTVYRGGYHLTLQTCIEYEGELSWGRLFIIADPIGIPEADLPDNPITSTPPGIFGTP